MKSAVKATEFDLPGLKSLYKGKVRDVYRLENDVLVMVATDRLSAFDVVMPQPIPFKGQVLNQMAAKFLDETSDIVPNWKLAVPDPNVTLGKLCAPLKVEMVVRGYLAGHAWRVYRSGERSICGVRVPGGLKQSERLPAPIITPTTKADKGHDEDISRDEIMSSGIVPAEIYEQLEAISLKLFERGTAAAREKGLLLVDTKYEFGLDSDGNITLIDEIHTADSSRYFYAESYERRLANDQPQRQLSKEFVREWLMENNFNGKPDQEIPVLPNSFINQVSERYIELYETLVGENFEKSDVVNVTERIENNILSYLKSN